MAEKTCPKWLNDAIFYEIYPQSFKDTNADGIGDFEGIISKLGYIADLGCNAIWLNPCFASPFGDAGYDVADYYKAAPRYGTNEDLRRLFEEAHRRGMHILLDLVPGHTSVEHAWFKQSMRSAQNEYTDRYVWTDSVWKSPEGYGCLRGISARDGSCMVNFFSCQPALNYGYYQPDPAEGWQQPTDAPGPQATIRAMIGVMRFWLQMGCDGFRVDMAGSLVKDDPEALGTMGVWRQVRAFLDEEFPEAAIISEWGEPEKSLAGGFHMDFLLHFGSSHYNDLFRCEKPFFAGEGDASAFVKRYMENHAAAAGRGLICIPSGNHDMERLSRRVHGEQLKIAFAFLLTMPGAPFIYYGDEIGMRYLEGLPSVEGGYERTGSRSPMQWDSSPGAGFSAAAKELFYIPQDETPGRPTVLAQLQDGHSLLSEAKRLIALRKSHTALQSWGEIEFVYAQKDACPLAYLRKNDAETLLVVLNPSAKEAACPIPHQPQQLLYAFGEPPRVQGKTIVSPPVSFAVYKV